MDTRATIATTTPTIVKTPDTPTHQGAEYQRVRVDDTPCGPAEPLPELDTNPLPSTAVTLRNTRRGRCPGATATARLLVVASPAY